MPFYAQYDPNVSAPSRVIGWYDTDTFRYPHFPAPSELIEVTSDQWAAHFNGPHEWGVSGGKLVEFYYPAAGQK